MPPPPPIAPPTQLPDAQRTGKSGFVLRNGIVGAGVPLALAADLLLLWYRGDMDLLLSPRHAFQLTFLLILIAPTAGALAGNAWWHRRR